MNVHSTDPLRQAEKKYRLPAKQTKAERKRNPHVPEDFTDVIDFSNLDANSVKNQEMIIKMEVANRFGLPQEMNVFQLKGFDGFYFLEKCMHNEVQLEYAQKCVREFSRLPYTNLTNIHASASDKSDIWDSPSYKLSSFRHLRWVNLGYAYDWSKREYKEFESKIPQGTEDLFISIAKVAGLHCFHPESGIVNYYSSLSTVMGCHLDDAEEDLDAPVVSISLGCSAIFLLGGLTKLDIPVPLYVRSGDAMILSGVARKSYHGVPRILPEIPPFFAQQDPQFNEYMQTTRLNINLRQVKKHLSCSFFLFVSVTAFFFFPFSCNSLQPLVHSRWRRQNMHSIHSI